MFLRKLSVQGSSICKKLKSKKVGKYRKDAKNVPSFEQKFKAFYR